MDGKDPLFEDKEYLEQDCPADIDFGLWFVGGQIKAFDALDRQVLVGCTNRPQDRHQLRVAI